MEPTILVACGQGHSISEEIQTPFKGFKLSQAQTDFNNEMTWCQLSTGHGFEKIATQLAFETYRHNKKLFWQQCSETYLVPAILFSCLSSMYGFNLVQNVIMLTLRLWNTIWTTTRKRRTQNTGLCFIRIIWNENSCCRRVCFNWAFQSSLLFFLSLSQSISSRLRTKHNPGLNAQIVHTCDHAIATKPKYFHDRNVVHAQLFAWAFWKTIPKRFFRYLSMLLSKLRPCE